MKRAELLAALAGHILAVEVPHPTRIAVDGCSAAGKTTLSDELAETLAAQTGRQVIRAGLDHFKRARPLRTRYPQDSPESYYLDSMDNAAILSELLVPLGPSGTRRYRTAIMNFMATEYLDTPYETAAEDAILIADGCFLQVPDLNPHWDLRIYLDVSFETVLRRGIERDQAWMDSAAEAKRRYLSKYIPGERLYVEEIDPASRAQLVVDNSDFDAPKLVHRGPMMRTL